MKFTKLLTDFFIKKNKSSTTSTGSTEETARCSQTVNSVLHQIDEITIPEKLNDCLKYKLLMAVWVPDKTYKVPISIKRN